MGTAFREPPSSALDEVRMGCLQRFWLAFLWRIAGQRHESEFQFQMGLDRMRDTGDYAPGANFDVMYPGWRDPDTTHRTIRWKRLMSAPIVNKALQENSLLD